MIQRIQSLYLLAAIVLSSALFFMPLAEFPGHEGALNTLSIFTLGAADGTSLMNTIALAVLNGVILLLTLLDLFLFKNRNLQARIALYTLLLNIGLAGMISWFIFQGQNELGVEALYKISDVFPLINGVLLFIARRRIRIDEALVKSIDRIR